MSLADGQTSLFTTQKSPKLHFAKAKAELQKQGVQFPIHFGLHCQPSGQQHGPTSISFKQSCRVSLGRDNAVVGPSKRFRMMISKISPTSAILLLREDYDISGGGWAPDYQDHRLTSKSISPVNGSVFYYLGIDAGSNNPAITQQLVLDQYANVERRRC